MDTVVEPTERGLWSVLRDAVPLLASVSLLLAGSGLAGTLIGARAGFEGFRPTVVGVVLAGFFAGFVVGSLIAPTAIARVGHIRVFAGLAALASGAVLIHVVFIEPATWFVLRAVVGFSIAALYVVCETWLNGVTTNRSRGALFAVYMIVVSASVLIGQVLYAVVGAHGYKPFILVSVLVSLSVVPISLSRVPAPAPIEPTPISIREVFAIAPLAPIGAAASGFIGAAMLGAGVVYATAAGFNRFATAAFVGAGLAGGMIIQLPIGAWSDRVDRRLVISITAGVAALVALVASQIPTDRRLILIALTGIAGGATYPIYSLSVAHLNDYLDSSSTVAGGSRMVLVNGLGSIGGPIVGSIAVGMIEPGALFVVLALAYLGVGAYALYRTQRRGAAVQEERATFAPALIGIGPGAQFVGEEEAGEVYPPGGGAAEFGDFRVHYLEQGLGPPVVLIGDVTGHHGDVWDELLAPLAADGIRAIAPLLGTGHDPDDDEVTEAVLALLRHLEIPSATFVGFASGARVAARLADEHADRTEAIALLVHPDAEHRPDEGTYVTLPTLVIDRQELADAPSDVADDIAEFIRRIPLPALLMHETGHIDAIGD